MNNATTDGRQIILALILLLEGLIGVVHGYIRRRGAVTASF